MLSCLHLQCARTWCSSGDFVWERVPAAKNSRGRQPSSLNHSTAKSGCVHTSTSWVCNFSLIGPTVPTPNKSLPGPEATLLPGWAPRKTLKIQSLQPGQESTYCRYLPICVYPSRSLGSLHSSSASPDCRDSRSKKYPQSFASGGTQHPHWSTCDSASHHILKPHPISQSSSHFMHLLSCLGKNGTKNKIKYNN